MAAPDDIYYRSLWVARRDAVASGKDEGNWQEAVAGALDGMRVELEERAR